MDGRHLEDGAARGIAFRPRFGKVLSGEGALARSSVIAVPENQLSEFQTTVSGLARAAARDERLATDYARLAAYMAQDGRPSAVDLFEGLSRHHAIRALEERGQLEATVHAQHDRAE